MSQLKRLKELKLILEKTEFIEKIIMEERTPFDDYQHKDIFQVDISFIEKMTGLKFNWKGVKKLTVPNCFYKLKSIVT